MTERAAVIDLGTNTWHLLVGHFDQAGELVRDYHERRYVFLYSQGEERIGPEPFGRALEAVKAYRDQVDKMGVSRIIANGTEGLRRAKNSRDLLQAIARETGIEVRLVSGEEEARLTEIGTDLALTELPAVPDDQLIIDIGGGSVEFILRIAGERRFVQSFPIGLGVMYPRFLAGDAYTVPELLDLRRWLAHHLKPLRAVLSRETPPVMVGAAGTFQVLAEMSNPGAKRGAATTLAVRPLRTLLSRIMTASTEERLKMPGLDPERVVMMPVACYLVDYVLDFCDPETVLVSQYGLKEGALKNLMYPKDD